MFCLNLTPYYFFRTFTVLQLDLGIQNWLLCREGLGWFFFLNMDILLAQPHLLTILSPAP